MERLFLTLMGLLTLVLPKLHDNCERSSMTQLSTIRKQLLKGNSLTQRSALLDFGIMSLPRRIADLKEAGFPIKSVIKNNPQTGQRYASYSFNKEVVHISQLNADCVYRIYDVYNSAFCESSLRDSDGYFRPLRNGHPIDTCIMVRMAENPQLISQTSLDVGNFKITYIGGLH